MPVGRVEFFNLAPMTFEEYLLAIEETQILESLGIPEKWPSLNDKAIRHLKNYLFTGGMPEAIKISIESKNSSDVRDVQRSVLQTYFQDFPKYSTRADLPRISTCFNRVPLFIGQKFKFSEFLPEYQSRDIRRVIDLLCDARVILKCLHTNASGIPLQALVDDSVYKLYFLDVGLFNSILGLNVSDLLELDGALLATKGMIAEQFVAQHLADFSNGLEKPELFYWLRDKKKSNAEVDFVISSGSEIIPIEVKSGRSKHLKSLDQFMYEGHAKRAIRLHLDEDFESFKFKTKRKAFDLLNIPLYAVGKINELIAR